jgi:TP901 family phage tail tape measure protein
MAGSSVVVELLLKARDLVSSPILGIVSVLKFLDSEISVIAGKIRGAFSGLFGGGLDGAKEFEAQLDKVQAKGDYTAESMEQLKKAAVEVGAKFGLTGTEAAQGMESLAAAGLNATQVMQALPPVLALAKAEGISMDAAAEKLSDSLSVMGLGFEQAARMADVLAKGANVSTTNASALAQALSTAGGIARTAGLDLEQTVGALSALANAGIKGERAGTALAAMLTQLTNPASAASKELSALGITTRDLGEVVGQLAAKGDASNTAILAFGETAGPGLRALIGQGQQSLNDLTGQLRNADGAAQQAADGIGGNLKGALQALQSTWDNVKTALFEPILQPLTEAARDAAEVLNTQLKDGALVPIQAAIKEFTANGIQAARDFIAGFDFKDALQSVQTLASGAVESFKSIADGGKTAADVVTIAWNAVTAGFRTVGSALLAVAASAVQTLANMEEVASHIGLGSQQRANELRETANGLQAKASELINQVATDGRELQAAYDRLTTSTDGAAAANQRLKDSLPAAELQTINKSLADYAAIAERANLAAQQAQKDFFAGKISMEQLADAADAATAATADLEDATRRDAEQQAAAAAAGQKAATQHKATAVELQAVAKASQDAADQQGKYTGALEQSSRANTDAIQAEIDLALAKGDTVTAAAKSVQLAQSEAEWAQRIADAKASEAAELQKVAVAQQAYLAAIGGGTAAQQQELQILQLKVGALQAEAAQAGATAEAKALAAQQTQQNTEQTQKNTEATEHHTVSAEKDAAATQKQATSFTRMEDAATGALRELSGLSDGMNALISSMLRVNDIGESFGHNFRGELGQLRLQMEQVNQAIEHNRNIIGPYFDGFERNVDVANAARKAYLDQAIAATELAGRLKDASDSADTNTIALRNLTREAEGSISGMELLDQQTLDRLQSEIDAANAKLREMQAEAEDARAEIARLNSEIAAEQGDTEKAALLKQQLDYQQALAEIEAKRAQAELEGNRELVALYDEQIRKQNELNALKEKNIKSDAKNNTTSSSNASNTRQPAAQLPGGTGAAQLPVNSSGGLTINVNAGNAQVLDNSFVEKLARALQPINQRLTRLSS